MVADPTLGRWNEAEQLAVQVAAFAGTPGAAVRIVQRGSEEWNKFAAQAAERFAVVDQRYESGSTAQLKGLPPRSQTFRPASSAGSSKERSLGWRAVRDAHQVFAGDDAQRAVIATVEGSGSFTVVGYAQRGDDLRILGGGSTHPAAAAEAGDRARLAAALGDVQPIAGRLPDREFGTDAGRRPAVPSAEQLGAVAWYSVNVLAERDARNVVADAPTDTWRGFDLEPERTPIAFGPELPGPGLTRLEVLGGSRKWTAEQVRDLVVTTNGRLPERRNPFAALSGTGTGVSGNRRFAVTCQQLLARGSRVAVVPGDQVPPRAAESGGLALSATTATKSSPDKPQAPRGTWTVSVHDPEGIPRLTATINRTANGDIQLGDYVGTRDLRPLAHLVAAREAAALGVGYRDHRGPTSTYPAGTAAANFREIRDVLGDQLDQIPGPDFGAAGAVAVAPDGVAAAVARFRDLKGDVIIVEPNGPLFEKLRAEVNERLAAAYQVPLDDDTLARFAAGAAPATGRAVDPGVASLAQVFHPPTGIATETGHVRDADYTKGTAVYPKGMKVAVALGPGGEIQAAAGFRATDERIVVDQVANLAPGHGDAVTAAIVDGVYREAAGRPVGGFGTDQVAAAYAAAGAHTGGQTAVDAQWLTNVEIAGSTAQECRLQANQLRPGMDPALGHEVARNVHAFARSGRQVAVLSHAIPDDRRRAEFVLNSVDGLVPREESAPPHALGTAQDDRHRVTVAFLDSGRPVGFSTVDSRPGQPIEVVDQSRQADQTQWAATEWWLANHQARLGREMRCSDALSEVILPPDADRADAAWDLNRSEWLAAAVHHRVEDHVSRSLAGVADGAGEDSPSINGDLIELPGQAKNAAAGPTMDQSKPPRSEPSRNQDTRGTER